MNQKLSIPPAAGATPASPAGELPSTASLTRRQFLTRTAAAAAWATVSIVPSRVLGLGGQTPPSEQITLGFIGLGIRGGNNDGAALLSGFTANPKSRVLAVCDVNRQRTDKCKTFVDEHHGNHDCATYQDFREMLLRKDIDAVTVATPEHWHGPMTVLACEQGKDVYCEKPMSLNVRQGRAMVNAARRYGRIVQIGSQSRSSKKFEFICRLIREEKIIGKLTRIVICCDGPSRIVRVPATGEPVPEFLDWDLWVGPAEWRPYNSGMCLGHGWNGCSSFGGGNLTDWGSHFFDVAQWALGMDYSGPVGIHPADGGQYKLPTLRYANGLEIQRMPRSAGGKGTDFIGTEGTIESTCWADFALFKPDSLGARFQIEANMTRGQSLPTCAAHIANFLDCIRTRRKPNADVEIGHRSVTCAHVSAIGDRLKRPLRWDPVSELFENDEEANRHLECALREPWHV